ncbi:MAG: DUF6159 family protein [Acidimicrobiales bacterium]|jgi:hypothetical protein|nr:DUF6159 family protein [Acidimicrobiales bacterium]
MGRISNTIELAKVSWSVLKKDRELLWIPVLSFLASIVVLAALLVPAIALLDTSSSSGTGDETSADPALIVIVIVATLAMSIISVFFNGALVAGAYERLSGGDPTVGSAIRRATARIGGLVPWAILTATVGMILRVLRERAGWIGQLLLSGVGFAWELASFLVVPAIVIDEKGAIDGLKTSGGMLRQTWGENIAARVGFGLLGFLAIIPAIALIALMAAVGEAALIVGVIIAVLYVALVVVVMTALNAVFQTALYLYASSGSVPADFADSNLRNSFSAK